ncbi:hypothetical protein LSUE1_G003224 [Lachnellula suecica]|uniref:Uncharacterized protein n=1 Tax=Lachnellula suecica TaxID=602035 RepID=A0A8T9C830_9HELO|nr:hypothetical protein LSUE1_G003224 [Lachnellula suecica]
MQVTTIVKSLALLVLVNAAPSALPYSVEVGEISGTYNGNAFAIRGDVQEVAAELEARHGPLQTRSAEFELQPVKREKLNKDGIICIPVSGQSWTWALTVDIQNGINTINSIGGSLGVNGHQCARLSCNGGAPGAGIFLCNDNDYKITPGLNYMATYANDIKNKCLINIPFGNQVSGGQEFDSDNYNIIVKEGCNAL